ncbi:FAD-dependent oxidoreductase [Persicobacter diffluens]|uniref:FAD-dependent oxidoreductase n=1 Tax=Persicobacter diffluens TaxID=981 RepID=A0AAN4W3U1_9BACT|nr:hypothetical protein PEDI_45870 [Persicobacter diffluens]
MEIVNFESARATKEVNINVDLVIVGGGLAGTCGAISAARQGLQVVLVQDRPVLGGNASSEVRLWSLGATSHMGNNNRWAREGGVIGEIMEENLYRNREGNPIFFDHILLDKVQAEENITLLLNTAAFAVDKAGETITEVSAFNAQNSTAYKLKGKYFMDASGDGIVSFLAGAAFRMGAERVEAFGEKMAPDVEKYGELLGHTIYFYTKDTGRPTKYVAPAHALKDITKLPKFAKIRPEHTGCNYWWIEYGGRLDTIHQTEEIKYELWRVVYGIWDYIKNSGKFPEAENLTLEWVGTVPGKRESRRFEGLTMLKQQDIIEQRTHTDAVAFGGWALDLHPADGVYSPLSSCSQWHGKGVYQIPLSISISKDVNNLFFGGRIVSASHVAFGSTRVMATCAVQAEAVGVAAAYCIKHNLYPAKAIKGKAIQSIQETLLAQNAYIPGLKLESAQDLTQQGNISVSSAWEMRALPAGAGKLVLNMPTAQIIPYTLGDSVSFSLPVEASEDTELLVRLRASKVETNFTPEGEMESKTIKLKKGRQEIEVKFETKIPATAYYFISFERNPAVSLIESDLRVSGILSVFRKQNIEVSNYGAQEPTEDIGVDAFEFWTPERRPKGKNIAMTFENALPVGRVEQLKNGINRPVLGTNAWIADPTEEEPTLTVSWNQAVTFQHIDLVFDADFDHPMESSQFGHPEQVVPFCVEAFKVYDDQENLLFEKSDNRNSWNHIVLAAPVRTSAIRVVCKRKDPNFPVSLFDIRCS